MSALATRGATVAQACIAEADRLRAAGREYDALVAEEWAREAADYVAFDRSYTRRSLELDSRGAQ